MDAFTTFYYAATIFPDHIIIAKQELIQKLMKWVAGLIRIAKLNACASEWEQGGMYQMR